MGFEPIAVLKQESIIDILQLITNFYKQKLKKVLYKKIKIGSLISFFLSINI